MCHHSVTASTRAHQAVLRASGLTRPESPMSEVATSIERQSVSCY